MSELAKELFDVLRNVAAASQAIAPGLKNIGSEVSAEVSRLGGLGASELAAALFKGDPFVMYGPNQKAAKVEQEHSVFGPEQPSAEPEIQQDQMGRSR